MADLGRPKIRLKDLPTNWRDLLVEIGRDGGTKAEAVVALGISHDTYLRLEREEPAFLEAERHRLALSHAWWSRHGRKMVTGECDRGNATVWVFSMKNMFGWHDRQHLDHSSSDGTMAPPSRIEIVAPGTSNDG